MRASGVLASARGLPGRRARCSLGFRIGAVAPRSNFLAHFSCVVVVSAAQRAASKADAAGCAVGYLLAKKTELSWLACDPFCSQERAFAHRGNIAKDALWRGPYRVRWRAAGFGGGSLAEEMGDAAQPRRRRRAAPRRTLSEQRKKPRTAAPAPKPSCRSGSAALFCSNLHSPAA